MAGHKPFTHTEEDRKLVSSLVGLGASHEYIVSCIVNPQTSKAMTPETPRVHFRVELDAAQVLFKQATGTGKGTVNAAIFWMKIQSGWKEMPKRMA